MACCFVWAQSACAAPPRPVAVDVKGGQALVRECGDSDAFAAPAPPVRIFGNAWYVGTCNVSSVLIVSPEGTVLIDTGPADAVSSLLANMEAAGFDPKDVRWIVTSHEHYDHVGGLAALKRATGAKVAALQSAVPTLESGKPGADDPQAQELAGFEPVSVDRVLQPGDIVEVGPIRLTAIATPGHTEGSTSWTWTGCEGAECRKLTYVDSLSAISLGTYRFQEHADRVEMFRHTIAMVEHMDCGILLTPHPSASALFERLAGEEPLLDPAACARLGSVAFHRLEKAVAP